MVVDDSRFQRKWIVKALTNLGHTTVEASNGAEAIAVLEKENPDAITMDINMPEMDGIQFLTLMQARSEMPRIVVISADIQAETKKECIELGAQAFINKPFEFENFTQAVNELLIPVKQDG